MGVTWVVGGVCLATDAFATDATLLRPYGTMGGVGCWHATDAALLCPYGTVGGGGYLATDASGASCYVPTGQGVSERSLSVTLR
ncbi:hypothetical protein [Spirosoma sp. 209]|uniref:hypothetical protein n=1 Tax=Spirosoma sp. 209 TaxID=1955701 RepID=UPI001116553E|nr:hypothetical protein [Spirosoma sp. 209]